VHPALLNVDGWDPWRLLGFCSLASSLRWFSAASRELRSISPVERDVQQVPWGPLTYWMTLTNVTGGPIQDLFGAAIVAVLFVLDRRAGWLMALGADRQSHRRERQDVC
jgi:hypothetical protein